MVRKNKDTMKRMKRAILKIYFKARAIWLIIRGDIVTYLPLDIMEKVGYVHIEVTSKDCEEIVNREMMVK